MLVSSSFKRSATIVIVLMMTSNLFLLSGCRTSAKHTALNNASLPDILPRKAFFERKGIGFNYRISPDGKKVAWLADRHGVLSLFQKPINDDTVQYINTKSWSNISWFRWEPDSEHIVYSFYSGPKRADHIFRSNIHTPHADPVNLTADAKNNAWLPQFCFSQAGHILIAQDKETEDCFNLYKIELESGKETLLAESIEDVRQWITDKEGNLKGCIRIEYDNDLVLQLYDSANDSWKDIALWGSKENVRFLGFSNTENELWLLSDKNRDKMALVRLNAENGKEILILEDPAADIIDVTFSLKYDKPLFAYSHPDYPKIHVLDHHFNVHMDVLSEEGFKGIQIIQMDKTETLWTVKLYDEIEEKYFLYDVSQEVKTYLGGKKLPFETEKMARTQPIDFNSRDGLKINGYLTKPTGIHSDSLPMVLLVHGGPWSRDFWQMNDLVQLLANRGYAVLQVNFRGSAGYGRAFMEAAINEFGKKMHDDLLDAVAWAVTNKIADPEKIAIVGGSYGGYAALVGATLTPEIFACAISINGISDVEQLIKDTQKGVPVYRKRGVDRVFEYIGKADTIAQKKNLEIRSPYFYADQVNKPVLIIYGGQDDTVKPIHSRKMITQLKKLNKDVDVLEFETERHGIHIWNHTEKMYRTMEMFLADHLGGRYEK